GFIGDPDVMDTWATSSLTPQIAGEWTEADSDLFDRVFPMDVRPQGHDIIRTWLFATMVRSHHEHGTPPWRNAALSGWILDPDRKKMSKSKGNVVTPMHLLDEHGADGVRYWAAGARLGMDTAFDDKVLKVGKRLVTKLFNAGKFVLGQEGPAAPVAAELDRAFVHRLSLLVERASASFDAFDYAHALQDTEAFFWQDFTDSYLELAKGRARDGRDGSAIAALRLGLNVLLRLFAPVLPYITEEVWSWAFAAETGHESIHRAPWPTAEELRAVPAPADPACFDAAVACLGAIHKAKTEGGVSIGREVERLRIAGRPDVLARVAPVLADVLATARVASHDVEARPDLPDGVFEILEATFAPPPAGGKEG
ncbi:valine--tRNA ligase, partial [bacterium]|nr:valine--tRNA ligase [bacterium]